MIEFGGYMGKGRNDAFRGYHSLRDPITTSLATKSDLLFHLRISLFFLTDKKKKNQTLNFEY